RALPQRHQRADRGVFRQAVIELGLVGMLQHVHDVRATHPLRIIDAGLLEATFLQIDDTFGRVFVHVFLGAETNGTGRADLDTGWLQVDGHAVRAQRALVGLVVLLADARHIERTADHAVAATDAMLADEIDDAVAVLDDGARRRAGLEAARILAVHAAILADQ